MALPVVSVSLHIGSTLLVTPTGRQAQVDWPTVHRQCHGVLASMGKFKFRQIAFTSFAE